MQRLEHLALHDVPPEIGNCHHQLAVVIYPLSQALHTVTDWLTITMHDGGVSV